VRYLCKRIAAGHPQLPIVVGLWGLRPDGQGLAVHLPSLEGVHFASTLGEARELVRRLAETIRGRQEAGLPGGVAKERPAESAGRRT
jgi:hypothetical protein